MARTRIDAFNYLRSSTLEPKASNTLSSKANYTRALIHIKMLNVGSCLNTPPRLEGVSRQSENTLSKVCRRLW